MDDQATEPIPQAAPLAERVRQQLSPSRIIAGISTTTAVVAVGALIWVVGQEPDGTAARESASPAVAGSPPRVTAQPVAAVPAPAVEPRAVEPANQPSDAPLVQAANPVGQESGARRNPMFSPIRPSTPAAPARPRAAAADTSADNRSPFDFTPPRADAYWPQPPALSGPNPQGTIDTVVNAVTGTAGWVGNGAFDILAAMIIAQGNGTAPGGSPEAGVAALLLPAVTGGNGTPGLPPPSVDWSKLPPPNLDFMRGVPPPNVDFSKIPPPNLDFLRNIPPPQMPPPPNLDFLQRIPPPQMPPPPNLDFLRSIPPPRFPGF